MGTYRACGDSMFAQRIAKARRDLGGPTVLHASVSSSERALCGTLARSGHIVLFFHREKADCPRCLELLRAPQEEAAAQP